MYGKFFASAFSGSMMGAGSDVFAVWGYVIAHAVDGQVELNPRFVAAQIGMTKEAARAAIDFLCSPDPHSRNPKCEGRRLVFQRGFTYTVPTHDDYRRIRCEDDRRAYNRIKQAEHRERVKASVNDSQSLSTLSAQAEADTDTEAKTRNTGEEIPGPLAVPEFIQAWQDWHDYRKEARRSRWTPRTRKSKLQELAKVGADRAVAAIRKSIANGWHGIFVDRETAKDDPDAGLTPYERELKRQAKAYQAAQGGGSW